MPLIPDKTQQQAFLKVIGQPEVEVESQAEFNDLALAAFRTENSLGSLIARNDGLPDDVVNNQSFNPWDHINDEERLDEVFTDNIARADSVEEIDAVRNQRAREQRDRKMLEDGGAEGFFAMMYAGGVDPINYIPVGGTAYKTYKTGASILKSAAVTA